MAAINAIAREWADEIRDGIAWVLIWKTGRSWNAHAVWLNSDDDTFEPEDLELARKVLEQDPKAVMVNGYYCGHFGEDMTLAELADGIRWNYENSCNLLDGSTAFPPEPMERPADLPASLPWYGKATSAELDPYVYDGYMSRRTTSSCTRTWRRISGSRKLKPAQLPALSTLTGSASTGRSRSWSSRTSPRLNRIPELRSPPSMELTLTITPDTAVSILNAIQPAALRFFQSVVEAVREAWQGVKKAAKAAGKIMARLAGKCMDAMLYNANDHPKWWHYYKHAKKYRVRKKYRRRLERQLCDKLLAAAAG